MRRVSRLIPKRYTKWFAAAEQVGISANNFLFSILIVKFGGVGVLGEYSFWFVLCQFLSMLAAGLCIRQMVLLYADDTVEKQRVAIAANFQIVLSFQFLQTAVLVLLVWLKPPGDSPFVFLLSVVAFTACLNLSELFRQYLYMRRRQRLSFIYTGVSLAISVVFFTGFVFSGRVGDLAQFAFFMQALGLFIYVITAISVMPNFLKELKMSNEVRSEIQKSQLEHGVPLLGGMLVTWLQNKSVTPILMFTMGPVVVGYYALATMIMSPANMIIAGLNKNALPHIRRAYGDGDVSNLLKTIKVHSRTCFIVLAVYVILATVVLLAGTALDKFATQKEFTLMFVLVVIVFLLSNYRFWGMQRYVVQMKFGFLFRIGVIATAITVSIMLFSGIVLKNALFVILASAIGELCLIYMLRRKSEAPLPPV